VFGDYDVDGLTATTLMYRCLKGLGADVICSLPSRDTTGYGLSAEAVDALAENGVSLIVTVDNGISAFDEVIYARTKGIDTIITDHHMVQESVPDAVAVIDPHREDDHSGFEDLAGVGVALKTAAALEETSVSEAVENYGFLAAIGTISDIMPMRKDNRYIVREGLKLIPFGGCPGLEALCETTGVDINSVNEMNVAFNLAPRLNAAGRMGNENLALELLLTEDEEEARRIAQEIDELNRQRQAVEQETSERINSILVQEVDYSSEPVFVVAAEGLHPGVMGIASSRLVDRYDKPAIVISVDGDTAKGSGRSVEGFSLYKMLASCSDLMDKFGGHDMAAGFTIRSDRIQELKDRIREYCREHADEYRIAEVNIDAEISAQDVSEEEVGGLDILKPFGNGNSQPYFLVRDCVVEGIYPLGERHTRISLRTGEKQFYAALFGTKPCQFPFETGEKVNAVVSLSLYNGQIRTMVSVKIIDIRRASITETDIDSFEELRRLNFTGKCGEDSPLRADRDDAAAVYRCIARGEVMVSSGADLCGKVKDMPLGKMLALLRVFAELNLARTEQIDGNKEIIVTVPTETKKDLMDSPTFRAICKQ
ncbi:MAG: single-stranded-DNA-specific exonuclease RecJ, partial [Oscillospiraceae bacterium]|nr:single-stranded-DNA-specific exonuclease RecJ [Oscillospiraceae bacterium]